MGPVLVPSAPGLLGSLVLRSSVETGRVVNAYSYYIKVAFSRHPSCFLMSF